MKQQRPPARIPYWLLAIYFIVVLGLGFCFPITQDESYYYNWAKALDFGYFDHPPAVAFLSHVSQLWDPNSVFCGRLLTALLSSLSVLLIFRIYMLYGFKRKNDYLVACALAVGNIAAIAAGTLTTPDTVLLFAWALALHEAGYALKYDQRRWLSAGVAVGVGLMGKYTMVLIGPVFLIALVRSRPEQLSKPWPYLGGLVALLVFSPNLYWNAQQDWVSLRFQFKHGLSMERANMLSGQLPVAAKASTSSPEFQLTKRFQMLDPQSVAVFKPQAFVSEPMSVDESSKQLNRFFAMLKHLSAGKNTVTRLLDFLGGQLAFYAFLLLPLVFSALWNLRRRQIFSAPDPIIGPMMTAAFAVPLVIFGCFSLNGKVEANWAAVAVIGGAPLLQRFCRAHVGAVLVSACLNFILIGMAAFYAQSPFARVNPGLDRLLRETHGFKQLASFAPIRQEQRFFADRFQLVSMLRFYNPSLAVGQWPGVTRVSEYVRNSAVWDPFDSNELLQRGYFYLLSSDVVPPSIPGFTATELTKIIDCREGYLKTKVSWLDLDLRPCSPVHEWSWVGYSRMSKQFATALIDS